MGISAVIFGGNWANAAICGSRCSNWNNSPSNSNANIGARGVCEDTERASTLCCGHGPAGRPFNVWSAMLSCFGEHVWRSGRAPSSRMAKGAASIHHA